MVLFEDINEWKASQKNSISASENTPKSGGGWNGNGHWLNSFSCLLSLKALESSELRGRVWGWLCFVFPQDLGSAETPVWLGLGQKPELTE